MMYPRRVALLVLCVLGAAAHAEGLRWDLDSLDVDIEIRPDGVLAITETIIADFTLERHHGIFREIPYSYQRHGTNFRLRIHVDRVTDQDANPRKYQSSTNDGMLILKIGDPNRKVSAAQTYVIQYTVQRGLLGFETHDELYWNAIGHGWPVPIEQATCSVTLPSGIEADAIRAASFQGSYGSDAAGPLGEVSQSMVEFHTNRELRPREALTIVIGWPKGHVVVPSRRDRMMWFLADNSLIVIPFILLPFLFVTTRWLGRDRGRARSIVVQYEPPDGLTPAEVGLIADERVDQRDITATVIDLAVRGYLRIEDRRRSRKPKLNKKRVVLVKTGKDPMDLKHFEFRMFSTIFPSAVTERRLEDLERRFYKAIPAIKDDLHKAMDKQGYTVGHLAKRRAAWVSFGVFIGVLVIGSAFLLVEHGGFAQVTTYIAGGLTAIQFPLFAMVMPRKTVKGRRALEGVRGLEEYIERAEVQELESAARRERFETLLPYAMALGLTKVWGEHFKGLFTEPPEWYTYPPGSRFTTIAMVSDLSRSSTMMGEVMVEAPRAESGSSFGGGGSGFSGGFSGGGGGGGGGGAW